MPKFTSRKIEDDEREEDKIIYPKFKKCDTDLLILSMHDGGTQAMCNAIMHNQHILNEKLDKLLGI